MTSSPVISRRVELVKLCSSRDWSKAIRILDALLADASSSSIQDICNRAFCYSQLDLHKHVIKDCDRALQMDSTVLQAYILKGHALSNLGRKDDALIAWEAGYEIAQFQSADLKQLMELEDLLRSSREQKRKIQEDPEKFRKIQEQLGGCGTQYVNNEQGKIDREVLESLDSLSNLTCLSSELADDYIIRASSGNGFEEQSSKGGLSSCFDILNVQNGIMREIGKTNGRAHVPEVQIDGFNGEIKLSGEFENPSDCNSSSVLHYSTESKLLGNRGKSEKSNDRLIADSLSDGSEHMSTAGSNPLTGVVSRSSVLDSASVSPSKREDPQAMGSDDHLRNKRYSSAKTAKINSISVDFRLSRGIAQVNEGQYATAISIFNQILKDDSSYAEALIGRGTAYAFQRELEAAISDFSSAIEYNPAACEAWKRRGQARAALGEFVEAINDLTKAMEFEPNSSDILHERGIVNFKSKDFFAAIDDLSMCVKLDKDFKSAFTYMGLALASAGEYERAEESHLKAISLDPNYLEAWIHLIQFYIDLANPAKAFDCIQKTIHIDSRCPKLYYLRGRLMHGLGEHSKAVKELSEGLSYESLNIDCLYLRASCYHAIGGYLEAVKDYDAILDLELDSMEKFALQCLAFYQKEMALYTASKAGSEFLWFEIDRDIDAMFKEYWCNKKHPKDVCEKVYRQPPLRESLKRDKVRKKEKSVAKRKSALVAAGDLVGKKIQYYCQGFLHNKRQHRMAGLAAIEVAQKISKVWRSLHFDWKSSNKSSGKVSYRSRRRTYMPIQTRGGGGCSTSSSTEMSSSSFSSEDRSSMRPLLSWCDVYSIAVKWRQISEPCDPVFWVNKLSEQFNAGFGSRASLVLGQAKTLCYYPYYDRTLNMAKTIMEDKLYVQNEAKNKIALSPDKLQSLLATETVQDLYEVVGEDFSIATWCDSSAYDGKRLEGSKITVTKLNERGYDFTVRTTCTSSKWNEFDEEMAAAWENICTEYCGESYGSLTLDALENVRDAILRMTYYWYNCKPLTKGSTVVGFIVLLGLLLAANMEFTGEIPRDVQLDWEAILNSHPSFFIDSTKSWLNPFLNASTKWKEYPDVASIFTTTRSIIEALSFKDE